MKLVIFYEFRLNVKSKSAFLFDRDLKKTFLNKILRRISPHFPYHLSVRYYLLGKNYAIIRF